jgi:hypothetical protein
MYLSKPTLAVILHMVVINSRKKKEVCFESKKRKFLNLNYKILVDSRMRALSNASPVNHFV